MHVVLLIATYVTKNDGSGRERITRANGLLHGRRFKSGGGKGTRGVPDAPTRVVVSPFVRQSFIARFAHNACAVHSVTK